MLKNLFFDASSLRPLFTTARKTQVHSSLLLSLRRFKTFVPTFFATFACYYNKEQIQLKVSNKKISDI